MRRSDLLPAKPAPSELDEIQARERREKVREVLESEAADRRERDAYRAIANPADVIYVPHAVQERLDEGKPTWRIRGGRYLKPKVATTDLSKRDLSAQAAKTIDLSRDGLTATLKRAAEGLPRELTLGLRSAVLKERHVLKARRRELLGDVSEDEFGALETEARNALERALVAEYGFLPRFQLRWIGTV